MAPGMMTPKFRDLMTKLIPINMPHFKPANTNELNEEDKLHITPENISQHVARLPTWKGEYCWSMNYEVKFLETLMQHGFLPMSSMVNSPWEANVCGSDHTAILTPRFHRTRCVLQLDNLVVETAATKRSKHFFFGMSACVDQAVPRIIADKTDGSSSEVTLCALKGCKNVYAAEIYKREEDGTQGELVAAEVGYVNGSCWMSIDGFFSTEHKSSGTILMCCLAKFLQANKFTMMDLGTPTPHTISRGAKEVKRSAFLEQLTAARAMETPSLEQFCDKVNAFEVMTGTKPIFGYKGGVTRFGFGLRRRRGKKHAKRNQSGLKQLPAAKYEMTQEQKELMSKLENEGILSGLAKAAAQKYHKFPEDVKFANAMEWARRMENKNRRGSKTQKKDRKIVYKAHHKKAVEEAQAKGQSLDEYIVEKFEALKTSSTPQMLVAKDVNMETEDAWIRRMMRKPRRAEQIRRGGKGYNLDVNAENMRKNQA